MSNGVGRRNDIILRDYLAIDRTRLANQRTLLSFLRTGLYLLVTALAVMRIDMLEGLSAMGGLFIAMSVVVTIVGFLNYFIMRRKIERHYQQQPDNVESK